MDRILTYIRENKNVIFIVIGQTALVVLGFMAVFYTVNFIINIPGFQFDPFLMILVAFLGWQFWRIMDKQNRIIEKQNDLIEYLSTLSERTTKYPALTGETLPKKKVPKK